MDNMVFNSDFPTIKPEPEDFTDVDQENSTYYNDENLSLQYEMPKLEIPHSVICFILHQLRLIYLKQYLNVI